MTLNLERQELDAILNILAERPFREVHQLVGKIVNQANEQLAQKPIGANGQDAEAHSQPLQ